MKLIPLTQGKFAQVDDEDYDFLMQWKWFAHRDESRKAPAWYAERRDGTRNHIKMHRQLMGCIKGDKKVVDHENHDTLDNQRKNLRIATPKQNAVNTISRAGSSSGFLGVCKYIQKCVRTNKRKPGIREYEYTYWLSQICPDRTKIRLGLFPFTPEGELMAAMAYDSAAQKHFGEFANLNFKVAC